MTLGVNRGGPETPPSRMARLRGRLGASPCRVGFHAWTPELEGYEDRGLFIDRALCEQCGNRFRSWRTRLRIRFRSWPCRVGWHYPVLTRTGGGDLRVICEHCGIFTPTT